MLSRREVLVGAVAGGPLSMVSWERAAAPATTRDTEAKGGAPAEAVPFTVAMPIPPVLRPRASSPRADTFRLRMTESEMEIVRGLRTTVRCYGGSFPGPTIRAVSGREVVIEQTNGLVVDTAVHLHGGNVPAASDGLPMDVISPGRSRVYHYPNRQPAASLWYHDHAHGLEAANVFMGLHGAYLLSDEDERNLPLPTGQYDVPLLIRDARIEQDGTLRYRRPIDCPHMLVNGKERPYLQVAARKYRLRVYNISVNRPLALRLADGAEFVQIASDCGLLASPVTVDEITLTSGERAEIVVDFSRYPVGSSVVLENTQAFRSERPEVLRIDIVRSAADPSRVPSRLAVLPQLPQPDAEREFVLTSSPDWLINGRTYDPDRVDVTTVLGNHEIWTIRNATAPGDGSGYFTHHSFHTHLARFRVLDRNGRAPGPGESGWKDTVTVPPGETVRIAMTWGDYPGRYVYHCHHLGHSSAGQMGTVEVVRRQH